MIDLTLDIPSQQWNEGKPQGKVRISKGRSWRGRKVDFRVGKKLVSLTMKKEEILSLGWRLIEASKAIDSIEANYG